MNIPRTAPSTLFLLVFATAACLTDSRGVQPDGAAPDGDGEGGEVTGGGGGEGLPGEGEGEGEGEAPGGDEGRDDEGKDDEGEDDDGKDDEGKDDDSPQDRCDKLCGLAYEACEPLGDLCEEDCDEWDDEIGWCLAEARGCREAFACLRDNDENPDEEDPRRPPDPRDDCRQTCEDLQNRCGDDVADACVLRCDEPAGPGFPAACVDDADDDCDETAACFGTEADVCEEVCPLAEAACPGLLEDCARTCAGLPAQATDCIETAQSCDDVLSCIFEQVSDCEETCGRIGDLCRKDVGECIELCEAGDLEADARLCAQNARDCRGYEQCVEFVDADCMGACGNIERVCPAQDDACNFDCGVWEQETVECVGVANSCGEYDACIGDEEGRDQPGPPDLPGGDDADEVCTGVCGGLIPADVCPDQNALCQRGCRSIGQPEWACVAGAPDGDDRCDAIQECIEGPAQEGADHARRCDDICDEVRRSCQGPLILFCEDTCRAMRPGDEQDADNIECLDEVMDDGLSRRDCDPIAQCLDLGFLVGGGRGGRDGGR